MKDDGADEEDGYDETLIPVDYQSKGQIRDDLVFSELVGCMPQGSTLTCLMDCCHSGSVLDLPYVFKADGEQQEMEENPKANLNSLQAMAISYLVKKVFGTGVAGQVATMVLVKLVSGISNGGGASSGSSGSGTSSSGKPSGGSGMDMVLPLLQQLFAMQCGGGTASTTSST